MCSLEKRGNIFFLTLTGEGENRLNPNLIASIRSSLAVVRQQSTPGTVLVTSGQGKYFCYGFDLAWAQANSDEKHSTADRLYQMVDLFKPLVSDLISLPIPTIAAVTGHAVAAGMALAISHDYIVMRSDRAVFYMSELEVGLSIPDYFTELFRSKIGSPGKRRDVLLKAAKVKAEEAAAMGLIESAHDSVEETMEAAVRMGEELAKRGWKGEVYSEIRKGLYPELCGLFGLATKKVIALPRL
ncbi:enoyl-CoA delta isomerase 2, peroxisomal-like [Impatiens glandulifera]|uniref:enoyl-CoA delta isomerase 2, peroxisomal-like n=1 Tax=Impatiens glandulifera TaxID=253017 RepID=UPI001FB1801F|nr:enoyl-CoA delta isomerase 2, peroxisomal-like [Impatiens glandulifera]